MKSLKSYLAAGVGFAMLVTIIFLATGWGSAVAAQISSVFVTNDTSHPVPVAQQGTANVNVTNSTVPVHEQGTAPIRAANEEVTVQKEFDESQANFCAGEVYTVPAGKRLVVEYIGLAAAGGNAPSLHANLFIDSGQGPLYLPFVVYAQGSGAFHASDAVHVSYPSGTTLRFEGDFQEQVFVTRACWVTVGGYLQPST
jgi:hypothetical protein